MKKKCLGKLLGIVCLIVVLLASTSIAFAAPAPPAKPIVLRYSTHNPLNEDITIAQNEWMDKVEKASNGRVKFERYYGGTLIPITSCWEELLKGVADVVAISAHSSPGEKAMPCHMMLNNSWIGVKDLATQIRIQKQLFREFPELAKEWAAVKALSLQGTDEFNIHTKKPVRTLADLKGMQLRGIGPWPKYTVEKLGASLVAVPFGEVSIALQKGIIDGMFHPNGSLVLYRLADVAKYTTKIGGIVPGVNERTCVNLNSWNRLPPDIQKIFEDTAEFMNERTIELRLKGRGDGEKYAREKGHEFISLPPADLERFLELIREEGRKSAEALDAKGFPGTKIYDRLQQLIKEAK